MILSESGELTREVSPKALFDGEKQIEGVSRGVAPDDVALMVVRGGLPVTIDGLYGRP